MPMLKRVQDPPFRVYFAEITPRIARKLLDTIPREKDRHGDPTGKPLDNRQPSLPRIERYMADLDDGFWMPTHQGIAVDENGELMDGQHRLEAVVRTGVSVTMMVSLGVPRDSFWYIDGGFTRNAQSFLDGKYRTQRTALARTLMRIEEFDGLAATSTVGNGRFPAHRILTWLENRPDVRDYGEGFSRSAVTATKNQFTGTSAVGLLVGGWIAGLKDTDRRTTWWEDVHAAATGEGLPDGNPVRALWKASPVGGNMTNVNYMRSLYAAAKYRDGQPLRSIRFGNYGEVRCWGSGDFVTVDSKSGRPVVDQAA